MKRIDKIYNLLAKAGDELVSLQEEYAEKKNHAMVDKSGRLIEKVISLLNKLEELE